MDSSNNKQNDEYDPKMDLNYHNAIKSIKALEEAGFQARMAGGCVRDRLLKQRPKDYDIATNAKPDQICTVFKQKNIKTVPTGIDHGTITVVIGGQPVEITSLRIDVATDGRRAVVAFGESFEEDSLRRDFTINALYEDKDGKIYDYHQGQTDLAQKTLRFVGNAQTRIREDYLRILRLFRFWARLGFEPAVGTLKTIQEEVQGLEQISSERITSELLLTLECVKAPEVVGAMITTGTLELVFQTKNLCTKHISALFLNRKTETPIARLAALLWDLPDISSKKQALSRLRLSRFQQDKILALFEEQLPTQPADPGEVFEWLDRIESKIGESAWNDLLLPVWTVLRPNTALLIMDQTIQRNGARRVCPIDGQFLIKNLELAQGPELGRLIAELKRGYRRGLWTTEKESLAFARENLKKKD